MTDRLIFLAFGCMAILAVLWLATAEPLRPVSEPVVLEGE